MEAGNWETISRATAKSHVIAIQHLRQGECRKGWLYRFDSVAEASILLHWKSKPDGGSFMNFDSIFVIPINNPNPKS